MHDGHWSINNVCDFNSNIQNSVFKYKTSVADQTDSHLSPVKSDTVMFTRYFFNSYINKQVAQSLMARGNRTGVLEASSNR